MNAHGFVQLRVEGLAHRYGRSRRVLQDVSFAAAKGEILAIVGRSGCGKSTILQLIAGFTQPSEGRIFVGGRLIGKPSPSCILMFQEPSLYPWMTAAENIGIGLVLTGKGKGARQEVQGLLALVQLEEFAGTNVQQLSGGQQQRVALARALILHPEVLLLDEPFSGLDPLTRAALQRDVREVARRLDLTLIIVTHDFDEAIVMADRVLVLAGRPGRIAGELAIKIDGLRSPDSIEFRHIRLLLADLFRDAEQAEAVPLEAEIPQRVSV